MFILKYSAYKNKIGHNHPLLEGTFNPAGTLCYIDVLFLIQVQLTFTDLKIPEDFLSQYHKKRFYVRVCLFYVVFMLTIEHTVMLVLC